MIDAKSLRIGNVIFGAFNDIDTGELKDKLVIVDGNLIKELEIHPYLRYNPIPLTTEILIAYGFFEKGSLTIDLNDNWHLGVSKGIIYLQFEADCKYSEGTVGTINFPEVKYLHQLQNLFFSLTNIELTFKH